MSTGLPFQWQCSVEELDGGEYRYECTGLGKLVAQLRVELDRGFREDTLMRQTLVIEE